MSASTMKDIEALAKRYADARGMLSDIVAALNYEREQVLRNYLTRLKRQVASAKGAEAELKSAIEASPALFEKPRTQVFHGVKVGFRKSTGKLEFDDPDQVVKLIRKHFPEQFDVLVKTAETPIKEALANLTAAELKKLGVEVAESGDVVLVKDAAGEVDKIVKALLKDEELEA
jgi:hypothetical protein